MNKLEQIQKDMQTCLYLSYDATCYETCGKILEEKEANIDEQRTNHHPPYHLRHARCEEKGPRFFLQTLAVITVYSSTNSAK